MYTPFTHDVSWLCHFLYCVHPSNYVLRLIIPRDESERFLALGVATVSPFYASVGIYLQPQQQKISDLKTAPGTSPFSRAVWFCALAFPIFYLQRSKFITCGRYSYEK